MTIPFLIVLAFIILVRCAPLSTVDARRIKVIDGDSIEITRGGRQQRCRLADIDAPEWDAFAGSDATAWMRNALAHGFFTVKTGQLDFYGRHLIHLYRNPLALPAPLMMVWIWATRPRGINGDLVAVGLARVLETGGSIRYLERTAKANGLGMWAAQSTPISYQAYREPDRRYGATDYDPYARNDVDDYPEAELPRQTRSATFVEPNLARLAWYRQQPPGA